METFEEHSILSKYKEGDNKDLGLWFLVSGSWLKEKNRKLQTRDRRLSPFFTDGLPYIEGDND